MCALPHPSHSELWFSPAWVCWWRSLKNYEPRVTPWSLAATLGADLVKDPLRPRCCRHKCVGLGVAKHQVKPMLLSTAELRRPGAPVNLSLLAEKIRACACWGGGALRPHPFLGSNWQVIVAGGGRVIFLSSEVTSKLPLLRKDPPTGAHAGD